MANFSSHISFGLAAAVMAVYCVTIFMPTAELDYLLAVFGLVVLGSVLPDMDSDTSLPFHVAFGSLSIVSGIVTLIGVLRSGLPTIWAFGCALGAVMFVWAILGTIFKKFTRHRGVVHSLPVALLNGLVAFVVFTKLAVADDRAFVLGLALTLGFLVHLILDEVWAAINFNGKLFVPNKAFGSALKFKAESLVVTLLVYGMICYLVVSHEEKLVQLSLEIGRAIAAGRYW
jgi:hypothetical protein